MQINKIILKNFRNYEQQEIVLNPNINVFYGNNAQGKTNILEAIFLCSFGKSFRTNKEKDMVQLQKENLQVEIAFQKVDRDGKIKVNIANKKQIEINGVKIKKLSDLLGKINVVIFTPDDIRILKEGPSERRRFLDMMIGQLRPNYVFRLNSYLKTLEQRNIYLKQIGQGLAKEDMLPIWNEKLAEDAVIIYQYRKEFIDKLKIKIDEIHKQITNQEETIKIEYFSDCEEKEEFIKLLESRKKLDIVKGFTTRGIHRDDFNTFINEKEISIYGSQGQHRTAILSLKLAEVYLIKDDIGEYPILLLDDFMSELDEKRRKSFLQYVKNTQIIITCTEVISFEEFYSNNTYQLFHVEKGKII